MMLTLLLIGMLTLAFNIRPVEASGTIYIRGDGSVDSSTANITSVDNVTYTLTGARDKISRGNIGRVTPMTPLLSYDNIFSSSVCIIIPIQRA